MRHKKLDGYSYWSGVIVGLVGVMVGHLIERFLL